MKNHSLHRITQFFNQIAPHYNAAAAVQQEVLARSLDRLSLIKHNPHTILDIGAGTGLANTLLQQRYPAATIFSLDAAVGMLHQVKTISSTHSVATHFNICALAEHLPFADHSIDFVFSNLMLHWCGDLAQVLAEIFRVLKPEGLFLFSCFGVDTLTELRHAFAYLDDYAHVNAFYDMHDIGDGLVRLGYQHPVMDMEHLTVEYDNFAQLISDIQNSLGPLIAEPRRSGCLTPRQQNYLQQCYRRHAQVSADASLPATFEIIYGHAWGGWPRQQVGVEGEIAVPIGVLKQK